MYSPVEEDYIKAILLLGSKKEDGLVRTAELATSLSHKPPTTTDMLVRLSKKKLIAYSKYKGARLTAKGRQLAMHIVRRHRLWESFLLDKLDFSWDEVHDIAEQLEHVSTPQLIDKLDHFLNHPTQDPHGEPIPDKKGKFPQLPTYYPLTHVAIKKKIKIEAVSNNEKTFLQYLDKLDIHIGNTYVLSDIDAFSSTIFLKNKRILYQVNVRAAENILVTYI